MSTKPANIALTVNGDTSQLRSDLKRGGRALESFEDKAKKMQVQILKVVSATTAVGLALTASIVKSSADAAKEIKILSLVSGESVEKFQQMSVAAAKYGVEQDKLADILKDTNDKVGDFLQTGGGALADYFEKIAPQIGQTADEFKNLSGSQALQKYVNGLKAAKVHLSQN